jgi:hypothetical protein
MPVKVVGAGVERTGTASLKLALQQLLGGRCHPVTNLTSSGVAIAEHQAVRGGAGVRDRLPRRVIWRGSRGQDLQGAALGRPNGT